MSRAFSTYAFRAELAKLPEDRQADLGKRAAAFAASLKVDFAEWEPATDATTLVEQLVEWLDCIGDIVDDLDLTGAATTTREDAIREAADDSASQRGAEEATEWANLEWRACILTYFEVAGQDAELTGRPIVVRDRWEALDLGDQVVREVTR